jgi:hypothetical protein
MNGRTICYAFACLVFVLALLLCNKARGDEPEPFRGIWCDTPQQLEAVVAKGIKLGGAAQGIQAVNAEEPEACSAYVIIGIRRERLHAVETPDGLLDIVKWEVIAVSTAVGFMKMRAGLHWYTLETSVRQGV